MRKKGLPIIIITRGTLHVVVIENIKKRRILKEKEYSWDLQNLEHVFHEIDQEFGIENVRFLFTKAVSYVVKVPIPKDIDRERKHQHIVSSLADRIPENFDNAYWDYVEVLGKDGNVAIVFVPVQDILSAILSSARILGWNIEAIETEELALQNDINPIFGLAKRKEKQIWQIGKGVEIKKENSRSPGFLWILLLLLMLAGLGLAGLLLKDQIFPFFQNTPIFSLLSKGRAELSDRTEVGAEVAGKTVTPNPTIEDNKDALPEVTKNIDLETITIFVEAPNALSSVALIDRLKGAGFLQFEEAIKKGESIRPKTTITISHNDSEILRQSFVQSLKSFYDLEFVNGTSTKYDVEIVIGESSN